MSLLRATILGCGSSGGVPRADGDWGECDPDEPKNYRKRCSLLLEKAADRAALDAGDAVTRILVDVSPDFRQQMLLTGTTRLDAVLVTHDHADQTHGIDDLRVYVYKARRRMPVWMNTWTQNSLASRFSYAFQAPEGSPYPAILDGQILPDPGRPLVIDGPGGPIDAVNFECDHGRIISLGFRFGPIVYSPDVSGVPDESYPVVEGAKIWILDALRDTPHPTHFSVGDALSAFERAGVEEGVLTNLHIDLDYNDLANRLPDHVIPAYDGLVIEAELPGGD